MPVIIYEGPQLNHEQSKTLISKFTDVACEVMPEVPRQAFYVFIRDYPAEKLGVGGLVLPEYLAQLQNK